MQLFVTDIQRFCMHDGPGLRTTVFLKGCPLRCFWCHNPETHQIGKQIAFYKTKCIGCGACTVCPNGLHRFAQEHTFTREACEKCGQCVSACPTGALKFVGKTMSVSDVLNEVMKDKAFYGQKGGLTVSGGEPLMQPEACIELLKQAKQAGITTAIETCGYFDSKLVKPLSEAADIVLFDIKDTDSDRHRKNTGVPTEAIQENLFKLDELGTPTVLRCVLLKGVNLNIEHLQNVHRIFKKLKNGVRVDFMACHELGAAKAESLATAYRDLKPYAPNADEMKWATDCFDRLNTTEQ